MAISLVQWHALIGIFDDCGISGKSTNSRHNLIRSFVSILENLLPFYHYITIIIFLYCFVLLLCHGDIEPNPSPKKLKKFPFCLPLES